MPAPATIRNQRERELVVYGPRGLPRLFDLLSPVIGRLTFRVVVTEH